MADLLVRVALDQSGIDAQLKGMLGKFKNIAKELASITVPAAAVLGIERTISALAALGEEAIKSAGTLQDQSAQLRVTAEWLQEYRLVASAAGVSSEQFDKALSILNRTVGQAALGQGNFEKTLESVGIHLRDSEGKIKSVSAVYKELGDKVRDGSLSQAQAIALASAAFGRDGGKMVEVLRQTEQQQRAVIDAAREYGAILSNEVVAAADEYGDKLELINKGTESLKTQSELILAPLTLKWAQLKNEIAGAVAELAQASGLIDDNATLQARRLKKLEEAIKNARDIHNVNAPDQPEAEDPYIASLMRDYAALRKEIAETKKAAEEASAKLTPKADDSGGGVQIESPADYKKRLNAMFPEFDLDAIRAKHAEVMQALPDLQQALNDALLDQEIETGASRIEVMRSMNEVELEMRTQYEGLFTKAHKDGVDERIAFSKMEAGLKVKTIVDSLVQITSGVATHDRKMFQLNKVAAISSAIINTAQGVTEALKLPPPISFAMAAATAAAGAAQISAIKGTQFGGGGAGTTPSAAGSTPTVNSQPVQQQRLLVEGISAGSLFSGNAVRDLAQRLIDFQKDGGQVVLK